MTAASHKQVSDLAMACLQANLASAPPRQAADQLRTRFRNDSFLKHVHQHHNVTIKDVEVPIF